MAARRDATARSAKRAANEKGARPEIVAEGPTKHLRREGDELVVVEERLTHPVPVPDWPRWKPRAKALEELERAQLIEDTETAYGPEWKRPKGSNDMVVERRS